MIKRKTFSEILEVKIAKEEKIIEKKQIEEKATKEEKQKRIVDLVHSHYEYAQKIIGKRFTMQQQHATMFYFIFKGKNTVYQCKIYSHNLEPEEDFEFSDYSFSSAHKSKLKNIDKNIKLNELSDNLIDWAEIVLEEELKK